MRFCPYVTSYAQSVSRSTEQPLPSPFRRALACPRRRRGHTAERFDVQAGGIDAKPRLLREVGLPPNCELSVKEGVPP